MAGTVSGVNLDFGDNTYARRAVLVDASGNALVTTRGLQVTTEGSDKTASGTLGALNSAVTLDVKGLGVVATEIDVGLTGTATYEATLDDTNWFVIVGQPATNAAGASSDTTPAGQIRRRFPVMGYSQFRARCSAYTSGSSALRMRGSVAATLLPFMDAISGIAVSLRGQGTSASLVPNGAALIDGFANPTTTQIEALLGLWNGSTWDRAPGNTTGQAVGNITSATTLGDSVSNTNGRSPVDIAGNLIYANNRPFLFNGTGFDRQRSKVPATLLASSARTTTQTSADIPTYNLRGLKAVLDMTVVGTGSVTLSINGKDQASGKYYNLLTGVAVTTNITSVYRIERALIVAANAVANDSLPAIIQIVVTANNANSATYSVGYELLP